MPRSWKRCAMSLFYPYFGLSPACGRLNRCPWSGLAVVVALDVLAAVVLDVVVVVSSADNAVDGVVIPGALSGWLEAEQRDVRGPCRKINPFNWTTTSFQQTLHVPTCFLSFWLIVEDSQPVCFRGGDWSFWLCCDSCWWLREFPFLCQSERMASEVAFTVALVNSTWQCSQQDAFLLRLYLFDSLPRKVCNQHIYQCAV